MSYGQQPRSKLIKTLLIKRGLPFFGNACFYAIDAGAPATVLSRYAMGYPKNAFF